MAKMNTWLPYADLEESMKVLDRQRLGKQRVEAMQILKALRTGGAWSKHPATLMWKGYEHWLVLYGLACCAEWRKRGYKDKLFDWFKSEFPDIDWEQAATPPWFGCEPIHSSHRGRLLAKDPIHYSQFGWTDEPTDRVLYARDIH